MLTLEKRPKLTKTQQQEVVDRLLELGFEQSPEGIIGYKTFGSEHLPPAHWKIEVGKTIQDECNFDIDQECSYGINIAPLSWVENEYGTDSNWDTEQHKYVYTYRDIYKILIKTAWLNGVCIPYNTDGKVRCQKLQIIAKLTGGNARRKRVRKSLGYHC